MPTLPRSMVASLGMGSKPGTGEPVAVPTIFVLMSVNVASSGLLGFVAPPLELPDAPLLPPLLPPPELPPPPDDDDAVLESPPSPCVATGVAGPPAW